MVLVSTEYSSVLLLDTSKYRVSDIPNTANRYPKVPLIDTLKYRVSDIPNTANRYPKVPLINTSRYHISDIRKHIISTRQYWQPPNPSKHAYLPITSIYILYTYNTYSYPLPYLIHLYVSCIMHSSISCTMSVTSTHMRTHMFFTINVHFLHALSYNTHGVQASCCNAIQCPYIIYTYSIHTPCTYTYAYHSHMHVHNTSYTLILFSYYHIHVLLTISCIFHNSEPYYVSMHHYQALHNIYIQYTCTLFILLTSISCTHYLIHTPCLTHIHSTIYQHA